MRRGVLQVAMPINEVEFLEKRVDEIKRLIANEGDGEEEAIRVFKRLEDHVDSCFGGN